MIIIETSSKNDDNNFIKEIDGKESEPKKWQSKREKKLNRKFHDSSIALYNPDISSSFDERAVKVTPHKSSDDHINKKRKAAIQLTNYKKTKKFETEK